MNVRDTGKAVDLVTGAFSYTGRFIVSELQLRGRMIRTMTGHSERDHSLGDQVEAVPYAFDDWQALVGSLEGVHTFYNTYWIRFERKGLTFRRAIENTRLLLEACQEAGVRRFVQVSVSNPEQGVGLPYYEGKVETERLVRSSGLSWVVVRPTLILGPNDILVNNIAWLLRRAPFFAVPGDGEYRLQPVTGDDVARIIVDAAHGGEERILDAAGPEVLSFRSLVEAIANALRRSGRVIQTPPGVALALSRIAGLFVRDVILTPQELKGLQRELLVSHEPPLGATGFSQWLKKHHTSLGRRYASEMERHFREGRR